MSRNTVSINLSDSYALLLDESLKENQALRQQLKERDEENGSKLGDISNKVDLLCQLLAEKNSGSNEEKPKKNCKVHVPTRCRTEFRRIYKCLMEDDASFQGFYLGESSTSARNKEAFGIVAETIKNDYGGVERCPWSPGQLRAAYLTYMRSLKDSQKRRRVQEKLEHKIVRRRQGRLREKITRRVSAIELLDWEDNNVRN